MRSAASGGRPPPVFIHAEHAVDVHFDQSDEAFPLTIQVGARHISPPDSQEFEIRRQQRDAGALSSLVSAEIIPRLMFAHRRAAPRPAPRTAQGSRPLTFTADDVNDFAQRLVAADERAAGLWVDALVEAGYSLDELLGTLFQPAARHLGRLWEEDTCCFSDVTIGMLRLQDLLRTLLPRFASTCDTPRPDRRVLLAAQPGDGHVFGIRMVAAYFARAGWLVNEDVQLGEEALLARVASERCAIVGLSLSSELFIPRLRTLIAKVRSTAGRRRVGVMVGGNLFNERPELLAQIGADFQACDGVSAVALAEQWCSAARMT